MIGLILAALLFASQLSPASVVSIVVDRALAHQVDPTEMVKLGTCESGLDPNAVGDQGTSLGAFQLHSGGLLDSFYADGYTDPFDVWQAADFTASVIADGGEHYWSCYWMIRNENPPWWGS